MNAPRPPWTTLAPAPFTSLYGVNQALANSSAGASLLDLLELVQTPVSQINGCAYCVDMHDTGTSDPHFEPSLPPYIAQRPPSGFGH